MNITSPAFGFKFNWFSFINSSFNLTQGPVIGIWFTARYARFISSIWQQSYQLSIGPIMQGQVRYHTNQQYSLDHQLDSLSHHLAPLRQRYSTNITPLYVTISSIAWTITRVITPIQSTSHHLQSEVYILFIQSTSLAIAHNAWVITYQAVQQL